MDGWRIEPHAALLSRALPQGAPAHRPLKCEPPLLDGAAFFHRTMALSAVCAFGGRPRRRGCGETGDGASSRVRLA